MNTRTHPRHQSQDHHVPLAKIADMRGELEAIPKPRRPKTRAIDGVGDPNNHHR